MAGATVPVLILRLAGPLQSWGERSMWNQRDTADMPTKSGIVGLLSCALGLERGDPRIGELSRSIQVAVRADRPGVMLMDYHTIKGSLPAASGGYRQGVGDVAVTQRMYLQDAAFTVAISGAEHLLEQLERALHDPKWLLYLGRKSCVPSVPVPDGIRYDFESLEDAIRRVEPLELRRSKRVSEDEKPRAARKMAYEIEGSFGPGYSRNDERISGGRDFRRRDVVRAYTEV